MKRKEKPRSQRGIRSGRQTWQVGAVVEIPLAHGEWAYAQIADETSAAFFDGKFVERPCVDEVVTLPVLFKVWMNSSPVNEGLWQKVGKAGVRDDVAQINDYFIQDIFSGELFIYTHDIDLEGRRKTTLAECIGLERAAVWNAQHIESRLDAHFYGSVDIYSDSIDLSKVPEWQRIKN